MKQFKPLFALVVLIAAVLTVNAQADITPAVVQALSKGDAAGIGKHLVASVDVAILDDEDMYPRDQVVAKLAVFFQKNTPKSFEIKHQGTSKLDDHYRIGDLTTSAGLFRVTFFMKKTGSTMEIKQLRIERY